MILLNGSEDSVQEGFKEHDDIFKSYFGAKIAVFGVSAKELKSCLFHATAVGAAIVKLFLSCQLSK